MSVESLAQNKYPIKGNDDGEMLMLMITIMKMKIMISIRGARFGRIYASSKLAGFSDF